MCSRLWAVPMPPDAKRSPAGNRRPLNDQPSPQESPASVDHPVASATTSRTKRKPVAGWVSWFVNGEAVHVPADSPNGQVITARLTELAPVDLRTDQRRRATLRRLIRPILDHGANIETATVRADKTYRNGRWAGTCTAPTSHPITGRLLPDRLCGTQFWGRRGQRFCCPACARRARRVAAQEPNYERPGLTPKVATFRVTSRSRLPGVSRPIIDVTAPLFAAVTP